MEDKSKHLRGILERNPAPADRRSELCCLMHFAPGRHKVGVFTWSEQRESEWLQKLLLSPAFRNQVKSLETFNLSDLRGGSLRNAASRCTFYILYLSRRKWEGVSNPNDLEILSAFEKRKVIVVIAGLDDSSVWNTENVMRHAEYLIVFNEAEMSQRETKGNRSHQRSAVLPIEDKASRSNMGGHQEKVAQGEPKKAFHRKHKVGIFSREAEGSYAWLQTLLQSQAFSSRVTEVRPCYISNTGGPQFRADVSRCTFGILYHSKNRGRINVTDVKDSLYDKELEILSRTLGKANVIVVIDDLADSGDAEKTRILETQISIGRLARDLFLYTKDDKNVMEADAASEKIKLLKRMLK